MFPTNSERLIGISDAFSAFVYGYPSSCPCAHCTPSKSVPTLRYTRRHGPVSTGHACRHLPSAVPWISEDRLLNTSVWIIRTFVPRRQWLFCSRKWRIITTESLQRIGEHLNSNFTASNIKITSHTSLAVSRFGLSARRLVSGRTSVRYRFWTALLSLQKGWGLWTLSCDFVYHFLLKH